MTENPPRVRDIIADVLEAHRDLWTTAEPDTVECTCLTWSAPIDRETGGRTTAREHRLHRADAVVQALRAS